MPRVKTHTPEELVSNHRESVAVYRRKHPEKQRAWSKAYYQKNKYKILERRRLTRLAKLAVG
jgi:flagellar biosynthesis chaperone FliJ